MAKVWSLSRLSSVAASSRRAADLLSRWKRIEAVRMRSTMAIDLGALLLADGVAENSPEQTNVLAQGRVLFVVLEGRSGAEILFGGDRHD